MPHLLRGTRVKTSFFRWLASVTEVHYEVPETILPVADATISWPQDWKVVESTVGQGAAGPANLTWGVRPPVGKSWLIKKISIVETVIRNGTTTLFLSRGGAAINTRIPIFLCNSTILPANVAVPVGPIVDTAGRQSYPGRDYDLFLSYSKQDELYFDVTLTMLNDQVAIRMLLLEQDEEIPPGG